MTLAIGTAPRPPIHPTAALANTPKVGSGPASRLVTLTVTGTAFAIVSMMDSLSHERRRARAKLKVIHRHRSEGREERRRESELVFTRSGAIAILEWIDMGGVRTPVFTCPLDRDKLHRESERTYSYEDVTQDPRDRDL